MNTDTMPTETTMRRATTILTFLLGLALLLPATMAATMSQAQAGPFGTLSDSRDEGKRTHKRAAKKAKREKKSTKRSSKRSSSTRVVRKGTRTTRHDSPRTVRRTTRSTRHGHRSHVRHHRSVRRHHVSHRQTEVHHHQRHDRSRSQVSSSHSSSGGSSIDAYVTGGLGISGLASDTITDTALPGAGYNVALGFKGDWLGAEFGINGGGYTFDPESSYTDLAMIGASADLKLQPSLSIFEPYASVGLGGYALNDAILDASTTGAALRLGLGLDVRIQDVAIGARYLHSTYRFGDENGLYGGAWGAQTETLGLNLAVYF